ncbi:MAG TPA: hypothetical protein VMJ10_37035 [Kofleriaceae bacterium]|nr:hypothetical protein [Kofleriaceae bacterium]
MVRFAVVAVLFLACTSSPAPRCESAGIADVELRDPATGQCSAVDPSCTCGPCPGTAELAVDWAMCNGTCDALDESSCLATPGCHAAYQDDPTPTPVFWGCWDLPPSGAIEGSCTGLDAQTCSEHDDCVSIYTGPVNQPPNFVESFERCAAKPTS